MADAKAEIKFTFNSEELNSYLEKVRLATIEMGEAIKSAEKAAEKLRKVVEDANRSTAEAREASRKLRQGRTW